MELNRSGQYAVWQRFSNDGGATWSTDTWVANVPSNLQTAIMQGSDGRLWLVAGYGPWFITSADGGLTWSSPTSLGSEGWGPDILQANDGKIWVVYSYPEQQYHGGAHLGAAMSEDGGVTWSFRQLALGRWYYNFNANLAQAADGTLVLMWDSEYTAPSRCQMESLNYRTSTDGGATWSSTAGWMPYAGHDAAPSMALLGNDGLGVVWESSRAGNNDIWFGILGATENPHPPPYVCCVEHVPSQPYEGEKVDIATSPQSQDLHMYLVWSRNGTAQPDLEFVDETPYYTDPCFDWYVRSGPSRPERRLPIRCARWTAMGTAYLCH